MEIDYSIILTKEQIENLPQSRYDYIINEAAKQLNTIRKQRDRGFTFKGNGPIFKIQNKAYEVVFLKNYINEDFITKTLIVSNIIYPNSKIIVDILLSKNITYNILYNNLSKISNLKQLILSEDNIKDDDITNKNLNTICRIIERYFSCDNYNLILAKLMQIVVYEKDLFQDLEISQKQMQKTR